MLNVPISPEITEPKSFRPAIHPVTLRGFLAGQPEDVAQAAAVAVALAVGFLLWALRGLRIAERAG